RTRPGNRRSSSAVQPRWSDPVASSAITGAPPTPLRAINARARQRLRATSAATTALRSTPARRSQARPDPRPSPDRAPPPTPHAGAPPEPDSTRAAYSQKRKNEDNEAPRECPTRSGKTGSGNPYLKRALGEAAAGAARTDTFLGERYRRLVRRRG